MSWLELKGEDFASGFNKRPFRISHSLVGHPLFELPRLVELAQRLGPWNEGGSVLYFNGDHEINQVDVDVPVTETKRTFLDRGLARPDLSVGEVVAQIEHCNAWMQLRNVGNDPEYRKLLNTLIDEFRPHAEPLAPGTCGVRADIFISSPNANTPFHMDEEHNFLLQLRGSKMIAIANGASRDVVSESNLIDFFRGDSELAPYSSHLEQHSTREELHPGDGVHIPPCHPHWVKNGDTVSISLGVVWHSDITADQRRLYAVNGWLRDAHLNPRPVGTAPWIDQLKLAPFRARRSVARVVRRGMGRPAIPEA